MNSRRVEGRRRREPHPLAPMRQQLLRAWIFSAVRAGYPWSHRRWRGSRRGRRFDEACKHAYETNNGIAFHQADVAKLEASKVDEWFGDATVRVLAGCAPCQPFSNYALRYQKDEKVEDDERWSLSITSARLVEELLPDIVTMENVPTVTKHSVFKDFKAHAGAARLRGLGRRHRLRRVRPPAAPPPHRASRVARTAKSSCASLTRRRAERSRT